MSARMDLRALVVGAFAAFSLASCDVALESGVYTCQDGKCPASMACDPDFVCRDLDAPGRYYDACGNDDDCRQGTCFRPGTAAVGICSTVCNTSTVCPSVEGGPATCAVGLNMMGACGNGCGGDVDCAEGLDCMQVPRALGAQACYPRQPSWSDAVACTTATSTMVCASPEQCTVASGQTNGVCALPCGQPTDACPADKVCVELSGLAQPFNGWACIRRCSSPSDCGSATLSCVERMPGESYCLPAGLTY